MDEIKFIRSHECINTPDNLAIEQYKVDDEPKWFINADNKLYGIMHCPFCGEPLDTKSHL